VVVAVADDDGGIISCSNGRAAVMVGVHFRKLSVIMAAAMVVEMSVLLM
jgi:hypothetical protein